MALTYRQTKGSALTIQELDANFQHFTGSHSVTGSQIISGSNTIIGDLTITGSILLSGSALITLTTQSILPNPVTFASSFAVSSSGIPFFSSGGAWIALF
jgi:hypothetical protein